jgi:hypothetical protein
MVGKKYICVYTKSLYGNKNYYTEGKIYRIKYIRSNRWGEEEYRLYHYDYSGKAEYLNDTCFYNDFKRYLEINTNIKVL